MARKVAKSLEDANNRAARGHNMYMKRKQKSEKWSTGYDHEFMQGNPTPPHFPLPLLLSLKLKHVIMPCAGLFTNLSRQHFTSMEESQNT